LYLRMFVPYPWIATELEIAKQKDSVHGGDLKGGILEFIEVQKALSLMRKGVSRQPPGKEWRRNQTGRTPLTWRQALRKSQ
jgi:hypothetical protein